MQEVALAGIRVVVDPDMPPGQFRIVQGFDWRKAMTYGSGRPRVPMTSLPAGVLTAEIVRKAMDALWNAPLCEPTPWEQARIHEIQAWDAVALRPDPEWAVTADGWRLVVYDGAMVGIEEGP